MELNFTLCYLQKRPGSLVWQDMKVSQKELGKNAVYLPTSSSDEEMVFTMAIHLSSQIETAENLTQPLNGSPASPENTNSQQSSPRVVGQLLLSQEN